MLSIAILEKGSFPVSIMTRKNLRLRSLRSLAMALSTLEEGEAIILRAHLGMSG